MKTKLGLAAFFAAMLALAGCATTTEAPAPAKPTGPAAADTGAAPKQEAPKAEAMPKAPSAADNLPVDWRVGFAFDSSALDEEGRKIVEEHGKYLTANPNFKVLLEGHADQRGSREYNLALGERRAKAVEKLLRVLGIDGKRVQVVSYGEEKPLAPESNDEAWMMNRRVEIIYQ